MKFLDKTGLSLVWNKITEKLNLKVDKVDGKQLSTEDYTTAEKTKLSGIDSELANKVGYTTNNNVKVRGTTQVTYTYDKSPMVVSGGMIIGGSAQAAGLVTRGICGVSSPDSITGSCAKSELYINYDGNNNYPRNLVLGAGSSGSAITTSTAKSSTATNTYGNIFSAVRGDQMVNYVTEKLGSITSANDAKVTIQQGSTTKGSFTLNQSTDTTITIDDIVTDSTVTENSTNPVQSGAVYKIIKDNEEVTSAALSALEGRLDNIDEATAGILYGIDERLNTITDTYATKTYVDSALGDINTILTNIVGE